MASSLVPDEGRVPDAELLRELKTLNIDYDDAFGSADTEVWPYKEMPVRSIRRYRVKRVVSPFEFYMEYVLDSDVEGYNEWVPHMQRFYNDPNLGPEWKVVSQ